MLSLYINKQVNRKTLKKIRKALAKTSVNDTVIFFISGHGIRADTSRKRAAKIAGEFGIKLSKGQSIGDPSKNPKKVNIYYYMPGNVNANKPWEKDTYGCHTLCLRWHTFEAEAASHRHLPKRREPCIVWL